MSTYKVYYFHGNMRASSIRAILAYSNAKWEDVRYTYEEWFAKIKQESGLEYKQLPAVEVDGTKWLVQTVATEVYLARKFGLLGTSDEDEYEILNLLGTREDISNLIYQIIFPTEDQQARMDELIAMLKGETGLPFFLEAWEKKYVAHHGKYFLGDKFTLADIFVTCFAETIFNMKGRKEFLDQLIPKHAPKLAAHIENIKNNELGNYFKTVFNYEAPF
jgi:glutathione S-transferase